MKKKFKVAVFSSIDIRFLHSGQRRRVNDLLLGLKESFDVDYIHFSDKKDTNEICERLKRNGIGYVKLKTGYNNILLRGLISFLQLVMFPFTGLKKSVFLGHLAAVKNKERLKSFDYDIVIAEYFMLAKVLSYCRNDCLRVIDMHDLQFLTLESQINDSKIKILKKQRISFARNFELNRLASADVIFAVNHNEMDYLRSKVTAKLIFVPLTIDNSYLDNSIDKLDFSTVRLAYFAGLSSKRSFHELEYIIYSFFDKLRDSLFERIELLVIGSEPSQAIQEICKKGGVQLIGETNNLFKTFSSVHFLINYWLEPSYGFRTRIIDSLSTGTPVIVNKACIDGMMLDESPGVLLFEDINDLYEIINMYLKDETAYVNLCEMAKITASNYSLDIVFNRVNKNLVEFK